MRRFNGDYNSNHDDGDGDDGEEEEFDSRALRWHKQNR